MDKVSEPRAITSQTPTTSRRTHTHSPHPHNTYAAWDCTLPGFDHTHEHQEYDFVILDKIALIVCTVHA